MSIVSIAKGRDPEVNVKEAINLLGGIKKFIKPGDKVLIKPNLVAPNPPPATTSLAVLRAIIELVKKANPSVISIGDSCSWPGKAEFGLGKYSNKDVLDRMGISKLAKEYHVRLCDFDRDGFKNVDIVDGLILKKANISKDVLNSNVIINVPVLKMHYETLVTMGIKNLHGILHDSYKIQFHRNDLNQKLVDLNKIVKSKLTIIDATEAMEGCGPVMGNPVKMGLIVASGDIVAADTVGAAIMGVDAGEVETIRIARSQGLGEGRLESILIKGLPLHRVREKLKRPNVEIGGTFPDLKVFKGGMCHFCLVRSWLFLRLLEDSDLLEKSGIQNIFVGKSMRIPGEDELEGKSVFVGDCSISSLRPLINVLGEKAVCLYGCPPIESPLVAVEELKEKTQKLEFSKTRGV